MAIAAVQENLRAGSGSVGATSFTTPTVTNASTTGNLLVMFVGVINTNSPGNIPNVSAITDTESNTWRVTSTGFTYSNNGTATAVAYALNSTGLTTSDTLTVHFSNNASLLQLFVYEFSGVGSENTLASVNNSANQAGFVSDPIASSTLALVVAAVGGNAASGTATDPTGYTRIDFSDSGKANLWAGYQVQSSLGTVDVATGTWSSNRRQNAVQIAFSASNSAPAQAVTVAPSSAALRQAAW